MLDLCFLYKQKHLTSRMRRFLRRFRKQKDGATALEFALIAPIFLFAIMGIFEIALVMFYSTILEGATNFGARVGKINPDAASGQTRNEYIFSQITHQLSGAIPVDQLQFSIKTYNNFGSVGQPEPCLAGSCTTSTTDPSQYTDVNGNGHWDADQGTASESAPGAIVQYEIAYNYHFFTPLVGQFFPNPLVIKGITVVRNEPAPL